MAFGPILERELLTVSRRARTFRRRCLLATLMLAVLGMYYYFATIVSGGGRISVRQTAKFAEAVFLAFALLLAFLTVWIVPAFVAGVIAGERERGSLGNLLTTRLSSAEIVFGKVIAGLLEYAACLATALPVLILLPMLGGVDPRMVLLACAAPAATALFLAGLSVLVSIGAKDGGRALREALTLTAAWLFLPFIVHESRALWLSSVTSWVDPVNSWLLASSPMGVLLSIGRGRSAQAFFDAVFWMIVLDVAGGVLMLASAVARLRAAERKRAGGEGRTFGRLTARFRWRLFGRPECGDNPVLWKEMYTGRPAGIGELVGILTFVAIFAAIGYGTYRFARPAVMESVAHGFGATFPDANRVAFNDFLRSVTSLVELVLMALVVGAGAETVAVERARATWDGLLATPLSGREIVWAKMFGAVWRSRWGVLLLAVLWAAGLVAGSLHPLGVATAVLVLGITLWFTAALGTYASLVARDGPQAATWTTVLVLLLTSSFLACYAPGGVSSILIATGSAPLVNWLCLVSYSDMNEAVGQGTFSHLTTMGVFTGEGPLRVLATCLIGPIGYAAGATWLTEAAFDRFDRIVGRAEQVQVPAFGRRARILPTLERRHQEPEPARVG
jgi:ABC-type transport system involved in multi-copper enzyme maturation permease subunit